MKQRDRHTTGGTGSPWTRRLIVVLLALVACLSLSASPAHADDCKPSGIPDRAGSGLAGMINPQIPTSHPKTYYGQYGWAGLQWHTCDLGDGGWGSDWVPDPAKDPDAYLDTFSGNLGLGLATILAASITQLHTWVSDPGSLMKPIDDSIDHVVTAIKGAVWSTWATALILLAACFAATWAWKGDIRRAARTFAAIVAACGVVYALGQQWTVQVPTKVATGETVPVTATKTGSTALASMFDGFTNGVVTTVDQKIADASGDKTDQTSVDADEARGATLDDKLLYKIWQRGATGSMDDNSRAGKSANTLYGAATVKWTELDKVDSDKRTDDYKNEADSLKNDAAGAYQVLTGKARGREGLGWLAAGYMILIAVVRITAEIFVLLGLLAIRIIVMLLPLFALAAIVEATRPIAIAAGKIAFAAVYNATVMGVIASVHTAIISAIVTNTQSNMIQGFVLVLALTVVLWMVSKPFRSITRPATGEAVASAMEGVGDAPGNAVSKVKGMAGSLASSYIGARVGSREGVKAGEHEAEEAGMPVPRRAATTYTATEDVSNEAPVMIEPAPRRMALEPGDSMQYAVPPANAAAVTPELPAAPERDAWEGDRIIEPAGPSGGAELVPYSGRESDSYDPGRPDFSEPVDMDQAPVRTPEAATPVASVTPAAAPVATPSSDPVFDPQSQPQQVTVEGRVLEITEEVPISRNVRYVEPEVNERGELTYDLWTPDTVPEVSIQEGEAVQ